MVTPWYSEQATVKVAKIAATIATNTLLSDSFHAIATNTMLGDNTLAPITAEIKDFSITGGERDLDAVKLLGYNELRDLKRSTPITATFTIVASDYDWLEAWLGDRATIYSDVDSSDTGYDRMQGGEKASTSHYSQRVAGCILVQFTDGTNNVSLLLNNVYFTNVETSLAADGTAEQKVTAKCLAQDFYWEDDFG